MTSTTIVLFGHTMRLTADSGELIESKWSEGDATPNETSGDVAPEQKTLKDAARQLEEYAAGRRSGFDVPLRPEGTVFRKMVWDELRMIPYGVTITYSELARRIGRPKAYRAVANACGANPLPVIIPCHRVVASGGRPGGYTGPPGIKKTLLALENQTAGNDVVMSDK